MCPIFCLLYEICRKLIFADSLFSVIIDYGKVQSKVSLKYDSWHKDALGKFGNLLGNEMSHFHSQVFFEMSL